MVLVLAALALGACKSNESPAPTSATAATTAATPSAAPAPSAHPLAKGDVAPDFRLEGSDGKQHALSDHAGKQVVVVAWFPKAFTGG